MNSLKDRNPREYRGKLVLIFSESDKRIYFWRFSTTLFNWGNRQRRDGKKQDLGDVCSKQFFEDSIFFVFSGISDKCVNYSENKVFPAAFAVANNQGCACNACPRVKKGREGNGCNTKMGFNFKKIMSKVVWSTGVDKIVWQVTKVLRQLGRTLF
jgi:hypothetical protein